MIFFLLSLSWSFYKLIFSTLVCVVCLALVVENTFTAHDEAVTRLRNRHRRQHRRRRRELLVGAAAAVSMEARPSKFLGLACVVAFASRAFSVEHWTRLVVLRLKSLTSNVY